MPVVVSASRSEQKLNESSVPITLVTSEDIHNSGLTRLEDVLRFYTAIDMHSENRIYKVVGIRGFHGEFSDRLLLLIDGRAIEDPVFGVANVSEIALAVEDIQRIEIIRGPGGAAWGANAFTGIINIITKDPRDIVGVLGTSTITEFGDNYTHARYVSTAGAWAWKMSVAYEAYESSEAALHDDHFFPVIFPEDIFATFPLSKRYRMVRICAWEPVICTEMTVKKKP